MTSSIFEIFDGAIDDQKTEMLKIACDFSCSFRDIFQVWFQFVTTTQQAIASHGFGINSTNRPPQPPLGATQLVSPLLHPERSQLDVKEGCEIEGCSPDGE